jgi:hypothetical protein
VFVRADEWHAHLRRDLSLIVIAVGAFAIGKAIWSVVTAVVGAAFALAFTLR